MPHRGYFQTFPSFQKLPDSEFADIPVPPTYVSSLKKAADVLFTSTYESLVWTFRRLTSYAILGMESTAANVDEISYASCPIPTIESYKILEKGLEKQRRIDYISPDGNCLFRSMSKELLGHEKFYHLIRQVLIQ